MQDLKVTLVQADLIWEDKEKNIAHISDLLVGVEHTDLIVLPEMFTTGFSMNTTALAENMKGQTMAWLKATSKNKNAVILGSIIIHDAGKYYNRLICMQPDGTCLYYDKRHLFSLGDEHKHYAAGDKKIFPEINGWKLLPLICYDLRFPIWSRQSSPYTEMGNNPYDVLLYVASWPEKRIAAWKQLLVARAIENQSYVIGVNRVGTDGNGLYYTGNSCVVDALGEKLVEIEHTESVKTITLSKDQLLTTRKKFPFLNDRDEFEIRQH